MQLAVAIIVFLLGSYASCAGGISLDEGWRYHVGEARGAETADFDDAAWNPTDLPHDAATEFATDPEAPSGGAGGFHRSGVMWYRKTWRPDSSKLGLGTADARLHLAFEGVTRHAEVWLNGEKLGSHAYDYTPFSFDVTRKLRWNTPNVIAVKIDSTAQPASRWYAGWGITRHISLQVTGPIDFQPQSLWTHTRSLDADRAEVRVLGAIQSEVVEGIPLRVMAKLTSPDGKSVSGRVDLGSVRAGVTPFEVTLEVPRPAAWSPESPSLYDLSVELEALAPSGPRRVATQTQRVGLRTMKVDPDRGLLLNSAPIRLFGGNVHHDHGPLGAASFDDAEVRRVSLLKQAGFNAVRTSHNPPSTAFLDACDAQGMLVIDEFFDGWKKKKVPHDYGDEFEPLWPEVVDATVRRDRRHPSVVIWSLGNEVYERGEVDGARIASKLSAATRRLDPTRPLTIGLNAPGEQPWSDLDDVFASVDVAGYNYESARFPADRQRLARRVMIATETYPAEVFAGWRATQSAPWVVGEFVWSAIDYLGEAGIGRVDPPGVKPLNHWEGNHFPYRAAVCGDIDLVGHRKPISHFRNIVWDRGEKLYAAVVAPTDGACGLTKWATEPLEPSWSWQVEPGTELTVVVASRWPRVRLELNGRVVAEEAVNESTEFTARFKVPYEAGELAIIGLDVAGNEAERQSLPTAGPPTKLRLTADRTKTTAGIGQLVFVDVELVNDAGLVHPRADREVRFEVTGPATLQAVGSADPTSTLPYAGDRFASHHGRLLAVLRSTGKPGRATLVARAAGLTDQRLEVEFLPQ